MVFAGFLPARTGIRAGVRGQVRIEVQVRVHDRTRIHVHTCGWFPVLWPDGILNSGTESDTGTVTGTDLGACMGMGPDTSMDTCMDVGPPSGMDPDTSMD